MLGGWGFLILMGDMSAEQFQLTLTHEGTNYSFVITVLKKGLNFHYVVRPLSENGEQPDIHVMPGRSEEEHWHFVCGKRDKATRYYPAELLEGIGEAIDRYNFTALV